jgi:hypothetical protein
MTSKSNLWRALADASSGIAPLAEDGRAEYGGGGYDYISAPGAVRALKPALLSVGLLPTVTGCQIVEVAGKQVAELQCRLVHLESGEELRDVFSLPTAPGRGRDEGKAAQAAITSGLGRWLRCLLLAVQAGEDEIDTTSTTSGKRAEPLERARSAEERQVLALAQEMGVEPDEAAMWATRVRQSDGRSTARLGTFEKMTADGLLDAGVEVLEADLAKATTRGLTARQFGETVVRPWCADQIPF